MFRSAQPAYDFPMIRWMPGRIFVLFLGLWVALAPATFAAPAAAMAVQSSMCNGAGGDCDSCPDIGMDREVCAFICLSAPQFTVPLDGVELSAAFALRRRPANEPVLYGRLSTPDPAPPKALSLL